MSQQGNEDGDVGNLAPCRHIRVSASWHHEAAAALQLFPALSIRRSRRPPCRSLANHSPKHLATMSFLRSQSSLRLSRTCYQHHSTSLQLSNARYLSQTPLRRLGEPDPKAIPDVDAMQMTEDQASMVVVDHKPDTAVGKYHPEDQPDYTATIDHGTSTYSPVPKRVMDGSESGHFTPAAVVSGAPVDLQARPVR